MSMDDVSRRRFMKGIAATAATVMILPRHVLAGPNDKLNVACIGCGGKGDSDVKSLSGENIVALCDVDDKPLEKQAKNHPSAKKYKDFRKMLDEMDKEIDAVTVSTPDFTHFPAAMAAIERGKHVFVQKPLTHNIWEVRRLAEAVRDKKVASQMGIQGHANDGARLLNEWLAAGVIGNVTEIQYCTNRPVWPQGIDRPTEVQQVPATLDWDLWQTVAQERPYNKAYCPFAWRGWWDYGCGALGDIGCHAMDAAFGALDLRNPISVEAVNADMHAETPPNYCTITYQFPARGALPPVKVVWQDGWGKKGAPEGPRPKDLEPDKKLPKETYAILYGEKGTLMHDFYCGQVWMIPDAKQKEAGLDKIPKSLPRSPGHMQEFIAACKGGKPAGANFEYAAALTEMVLLGNLAVRTGQKIEWDSKNMKVTNLADANKYLRREPRKGWDQYYKGSDVPPPPNPVFGPMVAAAMAKP